MGFFSDWREKRRRAKDQLLAGLAQSEADMLREENRKLVILDSKLERVHGDFSKLKGEENRILKLRKVLKKAQERKRKFLKKDFRLRKRIGVDLNGSHSHKGSWGLFQERRFARKRKKLLRREWKKLQKLKEELISLEHFTEQLHASEKDLYQEFHDFVEDIRKEGKLVTSTLRQSR